MSTLRERAQLQIEDINNASSSGLDSNEKPFFVADGEQQPQEFNASVAQN